MFLGDVGLAAARESRELAEGQVARGHLRWASVACEV